MEYEIELPDSMYRRLRFLSWKVNFVF